MKIPTGEQTERGWSRSLCDQLMSASVVLHDAAILYETLCSGCNCHSDDCPAKLGPNGPNGAPDSKDDLKGKAFSVDKTQDSEDEDMPDLDPPEGTTYATSLVQELLRLCPSADASLALMAWAGAFLGTEDSNDTETPLLDLDALDAVNAGLGTSASTSVPGPSDMHASASTPHVSVPGPSNMHASTPHVSGPTPSASGISLAYGLSGLAELASALPSTSSSAPPTATPPPPAAAISPSPPPLPAASVAVASAPPPPPAVASTAAATARPPPPAAPVAGPVVISDDEDYEPDEAELVQMYGGHVPPPPPQLTRAQASSGPAYLVVSGRPIHSGGRGRGYGIYFTWSETAERVLGVSRANFKRYDTLVSE
ncbi:hypothetical protein VKT23_016163 [Stygiomarasmius scandens]|uniref:Uncharacterized protein n=1 Tax=Marasmiellus scandens TaxID=2682957 RepID=A0ABR1IYG0_9AGAR